MLRPLHLPLLALCLTALARTAIGAAEPPIALAEALRLSVEEPRRFLTESPPWLLSAYSAVDPDWRREILFRRGRAAWMLSDRTAARDAATALDELATQKKMPVAHAYALLLRADESADFGHNESASDDVAAAAEILRRTKDPHWRALANTELCDVYWTGDQDALAMPYCRRAEKYWNAHGEDWLLARVENAISMLLSDADDDEQAIAVAQAAQARYRRLSMPSMVAMIDDNLSSLYLARGDAEKALALSQHALEGELEAGKANHAVSSRINIALALTSLGRHQEALASIDAALSQAQEAGLQSQLFSIHYAQMEAAEAAGKLTLALAAAKHAIDANAELSDERNSRAITEMETRYRAAEQKREIERLDQEQRIRELELARSNERNAHQSAQLARQDLWLWLIAVATSALFLVSVLLLVLWRSSRRHAARMRWLADTDGLTGVLNRRALVERMQGCFEGVQAGGGDACLCIIDADYFKRINDTRGHQVGDLALKRIARLLGDGLVGDERVGRMGGEEFALLLPGANAADGLERAEAVRTRIAGDHERADGIGFPMTVSIGVAALDRRTMADCEAWLVAADQALYRAKALGRNCSQLAGAPTAKPSDPQMTQMAQIGADGIAWDRPR
jgi:diguanylate cyclase (GGDEF)-like protein